MHAVNCCAEMNTSSAFGRNCQRAKRRRIQNNYKKYDALHCKFANNVKIIIENNKAMNASKLLILLNHLIYVITDNFHIYTAYFPMCECMCT